RGGDLGWCQNRSRYLVKQRLKDVVVATVDQNDVGITFLQGASSGDTSKSAADYYDALSPDGSRTGDWQAFFISRANAFRCAWALLLQSVSHGSPRVSFEAVRLLD